VRSFSEDRKTGVTKVSIAWKDPVVAAKWANDYVSLANERLRAASLSASEKNVEYLRQQLVITTIPAIQQALGRLLESEMQSALLARAKKDFAFTVVDPAVPPRFRTSPKRRYVLLISVFAGVVLSALLVITRATFYARRPEAPVTDL
jgi:uncharacterized protein involved in exopolysaccharide biosynthesis